MIHKLLASISAVIIIIFALSPLIIELQGLLGLLFMFLLLTGISVVIGVPTIIAVTFLLRKVKLSRAIEELIIAFFTITILFLWQFLVSQIMASDSYSPEQIQELFSLTDQLYASFIYFIISRIWYSAIMFSFNEFYLRRKYNKYALVTLIAHILIFLLACSAQLKFYTDPYIF